MCSQHSDNDDELNPLSITLNPVTIIDQVHAKQDVTKKLNPKEHLDHVTQVNTDVVTGPTTSDLIIVSPPNPDLDFVEQLKPEDVNLTNPKEVVVKKKKKKRVNIGPTVPNEDDTIKIADHVTQLNTDEISAPTTSDLIVVSPPNPDLDIVKQLNPEDVNLPNPKEVDNRKKKKKRVKDNNKNYDTPPAGLNEDDTIKISDHVNKLNPDEVCAPTTSDLIVVSPPNPDVTKLNPDEVSAPNPDLYIVKQLNPEVVSLPNPKEVVKKRKKSK